VKASVGLNKASQVDINELSSVISSPENLAVAQANCRLRGHPVRDNGRMLPLRSQRASASASAYGAVQKKEISFCALFFTDDVRSDNGRQLRANCERACPTPALSLWIRASLPQSPEIQSALDSAENVLAASISFLSLVARYELKALLE